MKRRFPAELSPQPHKQTDDQGGSKGSQAPSSLSKDETPVRPRNLFSDEEEEEKHTRGNDGVASGSSGRPQNEGLTASLDDEAFTELLDGRPTRRSTLVRSAPVDVSLLSPSPCRPRLASYSPDTCTPRDASFMTAHSQPPSAAWESSLCTPQVHLSQSVDCIAGGVAVATPQNFVDAFRNSGEIELTWEEQTPQRISRAPRLLSPTPAPSRFAKQEQAESRAGPPDGEPPPRIVVSPPTF